MGLTDLFSDLYAALSFTEMHAEAPEQKDGDEGKDEKEGGDKEELDDKEEGADGGEEGEEEGGDEKEGGEGVEKGGDEEEEEEEEEPEDPKPKLEAECAQSAQCAPLKHHYDECVERVHAQHSDSKHKGPKEDCVEEFFHLQHCATQCAAPKLFRQLK